MDKILMYHCRPKNIFLTYYFSQGLISLSSNLAKYHLQYPTDLSVYTTDGSLPNFNYPQLPTKELTHYT